MCVPCSVGFPVGISLRNWVVCPATACIATVVATVQPDPRAIPRACWMVPLFGRGKTFVIWMSAVQCHLALAGVWSLDGLTTKSRCSWEAVWYCLYITSCPETARLAEELVLHVKLELSSLVFSPPNKQLLEHWGRAELGKCQSEEKGLQDASSALVGCSNKHLQESYCSTDILMSL